MPVFPQLHPWPAPMTSTGIAKVQPIQATVSKRWLPNTWDPRRTRVSSLTTISPDSVWRTRIRLEEAIPLFITGKKHSTVPPKNQKKKDLTVFTENNPSMGGSPTREKGACVTPRRRKALLWTDQTPPAPFTKFQIEKPSLSLPVSMHACMQQLRQAPFPSLEDCERCRSAISLDVGSVQRSWVPGLDHWSLLSVCYERRYNMMLVWSWDFFHRSRMSERKACGLEGFSSAGQGTCKDTVWNRLCVFFLFWNKRHRPWNGALC